VPHPPYRCVYSLYDDISFTLTGHLCGACKLDNEGVGVLTMLCQECKDYNVYFLILLGKCNCVSVCVHPQIFVFSFS